MLLCLHLGIASLFGKWENKSQTRLPNDIFSTKQFVLGLKQNWMMKAAQLPQLEN